MENTTWAGLLSTTLLSIVSRTTTLLCLISMKKIIKQGNWKMGNQLCGNYKTSIRSSSPFTGFYDYFVYLYFSPSSLFIIQLMAVNQRLVSVPTVPNHFYTLPWLVPGRYCTYWCHNQQQQQIQPIWPFHKINKQSITLLSNGIDRQTSN